MNAGAYQMFIDCQQFSSLKYEICKNNRQLLENLSEFIKYVATKKFIKYVALIGRFLNDTIKFDTSFVKLICELDVGSRAWLTMLEPN